jgi:hypothetical protein
LIKLLFRASKVPIPKFLKGLLALAPETDPSLERMASVVGLAADTTYRKQALSQRLSLSKSIPPKTAKNPLSGLEQDFHRP